MRFSTSAVSVCLASVALAFPIIAPASSSNAVTTDVFQVTSDTGIVEVELPKLTTRDLETVQDVTDVADINEGGNILKARQDPAEVIELVNDIIEIGKSIDHWVQGIINDDIKRRQQFTQRTVASLRQKFPGTNFVMSNVGYSFNGHIITKQQVFYHNHIGRKVSYDIIAFKHGTFQLQGDGGFQNWAAETDASCQHKYKFISC